MSGYKPKKQSERTFRILKVVSSSGYKPKRKKKKNKGQKSYNTNKNY